MQKTDGTSRCFAQSENIKRQSLNYFCDFVNMMGRELGITFTTAQIIRLAECTPGITVHQATPIPEEQFDIDVHMAPIHSKEAIERQIGLKPMEE